ncbi:MAG: transporter substrate-binding domain-containing protein, partial [Methylococcales bacterium]|nr:transporter substrate-binding domain-containing protein [Methylococcales bacterium]
MRKLVKILFFCSIIILLTILPRNFLAWNIQRNKLHLPAIQSLQLSTEEQAWLKTHQSIRIAFDGYFPPYSFINESEKLTGISYDTIQLISKKLNIQVEIDDRIIWKDIYQATLDKEIDVIATMVNRPEREHQFSFTRPYVFKSLVIITHTTNQQIKNRNDLSGKTVSLMKNYRYTERVLNNFPEITPFYAENMREALKAVETQQVDAAIVFYAPSYFLQNKYLLSKIKFAAFFDRNSANESIAVRSDWPILASIFQKGLDAITEAEHQTIISKWYPPTALPIDYEMIGKISTTFAFILFILLSWIWQIKYQHKRIKKTQHKLLNTNRKLNNLKENLEIQVIQRTEQFRNSEQKYRSLVENLHDEYFFYQHDIDGVFTYLSPSITTILGYRTDEFLKHYNTYQTDHPDNTKIDTFKTKCVKGEKVPAYEIELIDKKGHKHSLEMLESPLHDSNGLCIG